MIRPRQQQGQQAWHVRDQLPVPPRNIGEAQHGEEHKQEVNDDHPVIGDADMDKVQESVMSKAGPTNAANDNNTNDNDITVKSQQTNATKITYLDGLRGYAVLLVFCHHALLHFFPAYILSMLDPPSRQHASAVINGYYPTPTTWNQTLLYFFIDGKMAVSIFFTLSGRVLVSSYLTAQEPKLHNIIRGTIRRIIRLGIPPIVIMICAWLLVKYGLSFSLKVSR